MFCYRLMPFGLKNVGATYQGPVNKIFKDQRLAATEVYVDVMLVKGCVLQSHAKDLEKTFATLHHTR